MRPAFTIASEPADGPEAVACLQAYYDELDERFPEGFDVDATTSADADELTPPRGDLLLVRDVDGNAVGIGAVKLLDDGRTVEVKRMWLAEQARGHGVGGELLVALEDRARALGATAAVLDTRQLLGAHHLYLRHGYEPCEPFNDNPYPDWWGRKEL